MTHKAISIPVGARTLLALFVLGLVAVLMSSGWQLREETRRRTAQLDQELRAIPLLYEGPLAYSLAQRPESVRGLLNHILQRHGLQRVELETATGQRYRALADEDGEPGPSAEFRVGQAGELRLQAPAATLTDTLRRDPMLRSTLLHLATVILLGLGAAVLLDRWLLQQLHRLSERARRFDPTRPPQSLHDEADEAPRPAELRRLEHAIEHVRSTLGDELERAQTQGRELQQEIARQHQALARAERSLEAQRRALAAMERLDALTGVATRAEFEVALRREFKRVQREQGRLALAVIDVDDLKPFNERHGRDQGDEVLKRLAELLARHFQRGTDLVARLGGEEFVVLLPGLDADAAQGALETLRDEWQARDGAMVGGSHDSGEAAVSTSAAPATITQRVTLSIGLAAHHGGHPYLTAQALLQAADEALYLAKHMGRDRICLAS